MPPIDLNLLAALDVLLAEGSVTVAAKRLGLSPSATSRTLARLRAATGDPLLVQAGRSLVPTPYAEQLAGFCQRRARTDDGRQAEVALAVQVLNRMIRKAKPITVRRQ